MLFLQEPNSNDFKLVDEQLNPKNKLIGNYEGGKVIEDFHHFRHSIDEVYVLWRQGQDSLGIVDVEEFKCVETIDKFWTFEGRSSMPVAACANRTATKIVGTSQTGPNTYAIHYFEDKGGEIIQWAKYLTQVIPSMFKLTCMEVSFDESRVYFAGLTIKNGGAGQAFIACCDFTKNLPIKGSFMLNDMNYGTPHRMKRMRGHEILVIACDKHFAVMEWTPSGFVQLGSVKNVHES
jgi:hypothetical protein